jgi:predicted GNAT family acetyltransferase
MADSPVITLEDGATNGRHVARVVEEARTKGFRIVALCPFAKATFERNPRRRDVLA